MDKNYSCNVVLDLLPSYIDGLCSDESREIVKQHLQNCESCRASYEAMKEGEDADVSASPTPAAVPSGSAPRHTALPSSPKVSIDEAEVLRKVKRRYFRRASIYAITGIVAGVILLTLILFSVRPLTKMSSSQYDVGYEIFDVQAAVKGESTFTFDELSGWDNMVFVYDENKDIDDCRFYAVDLPKSAGVRLAVEEDYLSNIPQITLVTYSSDYPIAECSEHVVVKGGSNYLHVDSVKTPLFSRPGNGVNTKTSIVLDRIDEMDR